MGVSRRGCSSSPNPRTPGRSRTRSWHWGWSACTGRGEKTALSVAVHPPAQAWRVLFGAASTGGAYNSGSFGAYGRLAAWQSMAALAGSVEGATAGEVEARVRDCVWYGFGAGTMSFERVA
ncbi:DUF6183 family protein [Kitasatospora sp. NPDC054939]